MAISDPLWCSARSGMWRGRGALIRTIFPKGRFTRQATGNLSLLLNRELQAIPSSLIMNVLYV